MSNASVHPQTSQPTLGEDGVTSPVGEMHPALVMNAYGASDRGKVRTRQEDQFVIATLTGTLWVHQSTIPQARVQCGSTCGQLLVVADGMGGHAGGARASALAVGEVENFLLSALGWLFQLNAEASLLDELKDALRRADAAVSAQAAENPEVGTMGTTLTLAYVVGTQLYVAHAGDTRCYLYRDGSLDQLTRDHTLLRDLVDAGVIKQEEMAGNRYRHVVTNVVGGGSKGIQAEVHRVDLAPGDVVLLSSDGLHDEVSNDAIRTVLESERDPRNVCDALVHAALDAGGRDNITVVAARFDVPGPRPSNPRSAPRSSRRPS